MISGGSPILTPRRSPAAAVTDPAPGPVAPAAAQLPPELEARIAAFENSSPAPDFDGASWFWMILWGVAIPLGLLAVGWWV